MKTILASVTLLFLLSGCSSFVKEGASDLDYAAADAACQEEIGAPFGGFMSAVMARGMAASSVLVEACMKERGWRLVGPMADGAPRVPMARSR
jgi:uncharacterized protein YceK